MNLNRELDDILRQKGAELVGFGDMTGVENCTALVGVAVALSIPKVILHDLQDGPTKEYHAMYHEWNARLNDIVEEGARFLQDCGYDALAQTTQVVSVTAEHNTRIPHKTVATRAGLGWSGKNCLLVTEEFGAAVRISSILTDAPLVTGEPYTQSRCGGCHQCVDHCPAHALTGAVWQPSTQREELLDAEQCDRTQKEIMMQRTGISQGLCGKCFAVCPYTQRYFRRATQ